MEEICHNQDSNVLQVNRNTESWSVSNMLEYHDVGLSTTPNYTELQSTYPVNTGGHPPLSYVEILWD